MITNQAHKAFGEYFAMAKPPMKPIAKPSYKPGKPMPKGGGKGKGC